MDHEFSFIAQFNCIINNLDRPAAKGWAGGSLGPVSRYGGNLNAACSGGDVQQLESFVPLGLVAYVVTGDGHYVGTNVADADSNMAAASLSKLLCKEVYLILASAFILKSTVNAALYLCKWQLPSMPHLPLSLLIPLRCSSSSSVHHQAE